MQGALLVLFITLTYSGLNISVLSATDLVPWCGPDWSGSGQIPVADSHEYEVS